ncbi:DUF4233 domain-containing protein [Canibacter zhoujuaniae]|uniref:DUF4233 domain-containing protein n=1 Tax=Canibacter zhoujuaniae TaxID=2708343 RepID=UPI00141DC7DE|nr:DUF4233 domain-containing protein [Canibacter zhoujuaniae]
MADDLELSPSERAGVNYANRLSGGHHGRGSTQKALASIALGFEIIIIFLVGMTMYGLNVFDPPQIGIYAGLILCALCVVALLVMRTPIGITVGWLVQIILFAAAFFLPATLIVAVLFGGLWVFAMIKGKQIDRMRAAWAANPEKFQR